ncbi:DUF485 domain-containing protein [Streptomyces sp. NPDC053367]|uniref:DUF485 domain-containing protein n=1 Tax=Streptomyces sp. NPDC053367 TaxID=3365700 RepID=UPI0037D1E96C
MSHDPSPSYPHTPPPHPSAPYPSPPYAAQPYAPQPYTSQPYTSQPYASPSYAAYPWQPAPDGAQHPTAPAPAHAPLGHHSDLRVLRSAYRWQRRTATLTALGYFVLFLVMSALAPGFMTDTAANGLPVGLLLALVQLPVTWLAIALYEYTARRYVDPIADRIREHARLNAKREAGR